MIKLFTSLALAAMALTVSACGGRARAVAESAPDSVATERLAAIDRSVAAFSGDSALAMVEAQVAFGPRVPGTQAHDRCGRWLQSTLRRRGADTVIVQRGTVIAGDGTTQQASNILARFGVDAPRRIILLAHWDTRPWADRDDDEAARSQSFDGANDGGSGVAVLLEIARLLGQTPAPIGVDLLLTDVEDYGPRYDGSDHSDNSDTWCLGARYFADNLPYSASDMPAYGILLDMVGGRDARFHREYFSMQAASPIVARVWAEARRQGYADIFPDITWGAVTDDHVPLIQAGIPTIDIIENNHPATEGFNPTWHTRHDNLSAIDPATLQAVGRTVAGVIYGER